MNTRSLRTWKVSSANRIRSGALVVLSGAYGVLWIGGVTHYWLRGGSTPKPSWLAALFLLLAGLIVLLGATNVRSLLAVALLGFVAEVIGVHLHEPFGSYRYTDALGQKLFDVPPVMAFAWMALAAYVVQSLQHFQIPIGLKLFGVFFGSFVALVRTILTAMWLTAFDLVIDPLASNQLHYWIWTTRGPFFGVPVKNFVGWFAVSLVACAILNRHSSNNSVARIIGLSLILFFTLIALAFGNYVVCLIGFILMIVHLATSSRQLEPLLG